MLLEAILRKLKRYCDDVEIQDQLELKDFLLIQSFVDVLMETNRTNHEYSHCTIKFRPYSKTTVFHFYTKEGKCCDMNYGELYQYFTTVLGEEK